MSDALMMHEGLTARPGSGWLRDWMRLHAWSVRRRSGVAAVIAVIAALSAGVVIVEADLLGVRTARTELDDTEHKLADAQRVVARLPAIRQAVSGVPRGSRESTAADDVRLVSELTSTAGLTLVTLEPSAPGGAGAEAFRSMKFAAQGSFAQLRAFLAGLATQPVLVLPGDLTIKREGEGLSIAATVQVFDGLPPIQLDATSGDRNGVATDPFTSSATDGSGKGALRLTGVLQDRASIVALVESASGTQAVRAGQVFGGVRVEQVLPSRVVFTEGGKSQILTWAEEAK
ncbi:hypothetical protein [Paraburkholderia dinghuensis]|uniref:Pilus assembly protein n=1 Tax=Paraburkholderia dinghuensis TaxID=2305225 RepID=A0A3N6N533_9BURK|nr:hypothetical protein [Paraburkholderia dinghuensis]RQH02917.1 hypothetical protein D1Y85_21080 [Paraburkholderia dinghuensis]